MHLGQRIGVNRTVIALSQGNDGENDSPWYLVLLMNTDPDAAKKYTVSWMMRGTDETRTIGWHFKLLGGDDTIFNAAAMYDAHIFATPPLPPNEEISNG